VDVLGAVGLVLLAVVALDVVWGTIIGISMLAGALS